MRYSLLICLILMLGCARVNAMDGKNAASTEAFSYSKIIADLRKSYEIADMQLPMFRLQSTVYRFLDASNLEIEVVSKLVDFIHDDFQVAQIGTQYQQYFLNKKIHLNERITFSMGAGAVLSFKTDESSKNILVNNGFTIKRTGIPVAVSQISLNAVQPISERSTVNFGIKYVKDFDVFSSKKGAYLKSMSESQFSLEYILIF